MAESLSTPASAALPPPYLARGLPIRIQKADLVLWLYWLMQPALLSLFWTVGRDTETYLDLLDSEGSYLEPFWFVVSTGLAFVGLGDVELRAFAMLMTLSIAGFLVVRWVKRNGVIHTSGGLLILAFILSYQVSFVTGALRQGISVLFVSAFLLGGAKWSFWAGVLTHWSGVAYLALRARLYPLLAAVALVILYAGYQEPAYIASAASRTELYVDMLQDLSTTEVLLLTANKALHIFFIVFGYKRLRSHLPGHVLVGVYFAPLLQLAILWATRSELIFHRAGMILDPFVIVATIVLLVRGNAFTRVSMGALVLSKFATRLLAAYS